MIINKGVIQVIMKWQTFYIFDIETPPSQVDVTASLKCGKETKLVMCYNYKVICDEKTAWSHFENV